MKKILIAIIASSAVSLAFAAPVESQATAQTAAQTAAPTFDNTKIKCGETTLKNGANTDTLTGICKDFKFGKDKASFIDENSGKQVMCKEKRGKLILSSCQAKQ